jgi:hypothetical protein
MSIAYVQDNTKFVADKVAPLLSSDKRSDKYAIWSKADFLRRQMRQMGENDPAPEMSFAVDTSNTYYCKTYGGKKFLSDQQRANYDTPLKADRATVNFVTQQALIERDALWAANCFQASTWANDSTPATTWDSSSATPIDDMRTGIRTIKSSIGALPGKIKLVLGADVWDKLQDHTTLLDRIKHTQTGVVTTDLLAQVLDIGDVVVAETIYNSSSAGAAGSYAEIFNPKDALLIYVTDSPSHDEPSGSYTFSWDQFDNVKDGNVAIKTWRQDDPDGEYFRAMLSFDPKVVATDCGYFFDGAVA